MSEDVLLGRFAASGDADAFAEIVRRHAGMVYGACLRVLRDSDKAGDVVQETFLQLVRSAGTVSGSVPCWLHRVATRKAIDAIRKDSSRRRQEISYTFDKPTTVDSWEELSPYIDEEMDKLDEQTREVLIRHFLEGRTTRDIGGQMQISQATVSRRIESGVDRLREGLRRRGMIIGVPVLGVLLTRSAAEAAPALVLRELGKMAIAGAKAASAAGGAAAAGSGATKAAIGGVLTGAKLKIITAAAVVAAGVGSVATYKYIGRPSEPSSISATDESDELNLVRRPRGSAPSQPVSVSQVGRSSGAVQTQQEVPPVPAGLSTNVAARRPAEPEVGKPAAQPGGDDAAVGSSGGGAGEQATGATATQEPAEEPANDQGMGGMMGGYGGYAETEPAEPNSEDDSSTPEQ